MKTIKLRLAAATALGLVLAAGSTAQAAELRYATGFGPNSTGANASNAAADYLSQITNGEMTMQVFPQSLLGFAEMSSGVRDGIADAGFVLFPYFPAEYRNSSLIADLNMVLTLEQTGDRGGLAWTGALTEYIVMHCDACRAEIAEQNQVYTSTSATEYNLLCKPEVNTEADLKGLKIRAPGGNWNRWVEAFGAVPVSLPFAEMYEGMSQGIIDCSIASFTELVDQGLMDEVTSIVTDVPGGAFGGSAMFNINRDVWQSMTAGERESYMKAANYGGAITSWEYRANNAAAREKAIAAGIDVHEADQALHDKTMEWIRNDIATVTQLYSEKYGVENTQESADAFLEIFGKWAGLVDGIDSGEALADLIWQEVGSKVDFETYGM